MGTNGAASTGRWPRHGWLGLALILLFWPLNWGLEGLRSHWGFFPLWLGYALTVDALVLRRQGHSLATRSPLAFGALFLLSAPAWWLFELLNLRTQNWLYLGREAFTGLEYALFASLSFSTVMPAVFGTAELAGTWGPIRRLPRGPVLTPSPAFLRAMAALGAALLLLTLLFPRLFFPLLWGSLYCLIEPLNHWLGRRTLLGSLARGDWRPVVALSLGCLLCGFFWEMWNYYAYPKWVYRIPYADWLPLFEMPLAGYLGYIPFSWELYALYQFAAGWLPEQAGSRQLRLVGTGSGS